MAVFRFRVVISQVLVVMVAAAAVVVLARLVVAAVRLVRADRPTRVNMARAWWHARRWPYLARQLRLAREETSGRLTRRALPGADSAPVAEGARVRLRYPKARFRATRYGMRIDMRALPGACGQLELERAADHLRHSWRAVRVEVSSPRPGRLRVMSFRTDPLTEPVPASVLPPFDGRNLTLGRDSAGDLRTVSLANLSGSVIAGMPGRGKTESALGLAVQLAPSPDVEWHIIDGGACDWQVWEPLASTYTDDDIFAARASLEDAHAEMVRRRRELATMPVRNGWAGVAPWPFYWVLMEEAHWYLDDAITKGDKAKEAETRAIKAMAGQLLRRGRAARMHVTMVVQKATGTGGMPPDLRDLCGLRWSMGVPTTDMAVAVLGDDIKKHESLSPCLLQSPEHVGIASALLTTGTTPYTLIKFPHIGQLADETIAAHRDRAPEPLSVPVTA